MAMINNSFPNVASHTIYVISGDVSCPHSVASNSGTLLCIAYDTNESNKAVLNTAHLKGNPIFTSIHGLQALREQRHDDPVLVNYKVKAYPSRLCNGGGGVWFGGDEVPV